MKLELFSVPLFIGNVDLKKIKLDATMGEAYMSKTPSSFNKKNILDSESEQYLLSVISELLRENYQNFSVRFEDIWRNKYVDNDFQEPHVHTGPKSKFSFILYEKFDLNPHTIFFNPAKYLISATMGDNHFGISQTFTPSVKAGQIIVFPAYVEHMVNRNSDQVTISGNLDFKFIEMEKK
jgi:hypothetical protein